MKAYEGRVSGPLMDRIDMRVDAPAVRWRELRGGARTVADLAGSERILAVHVARAVGYRVRHREDDAAPADSVP